MCVIQGTRTLPAAVDAYPIDHHAHYRGVDGAVCGVLVAHHVSVVVHEVGVCAAGVEHIDAAVRLQRSVTCAPSRCLYNCTPVRRAILNCVIYFQDACPSNSTRLSIHAAPKSPPLRRDTRRRQQSKRPRELDKHRPAKKQLHRQWCKKSANAYPKTKGARHN